MSAAQYTYEATWSQTDRVFIARVKEFPALEARGNSRESSIRALRNVVAAVLKDLVETGQEIPPRAKPKKAGDK
jgi:predicted RNase H-like HicB family nuclease